MWLNGENITDGLLVPFQANSECTVFYKKYEVGDKLRKGRNTIYVLLGNGLWRDMYAPVNPDCKAAGICLAESFADLYQKDHNVTVGLIPCANGGT